MTWLDGPVDCLGYDRGADFTCVVNLSAQPTDLPEHVDVLLTSNPLTGDGLLPPDTAAWLRRS